MQYKESNKIENILAKAKELEQDVSNIHFKDCNENNIDFYLSISADKKDIPGIDSSDCTVVS